MKEKTSAELRFDWNSRSFVYNRHGLELADRHRWRAIFAVQGGVRRKG